MLVQNGSGLQTKATVSCAKCGNQLASGAWLCPKCGNAVAGNEARLKELNLKQRYTQDDTRRKVPQLASVLARNEYVAYCFYGRFGYFAVTEKRLLTYTKDSIFGDRKLEQYDWSEVVSPGDVRFFGQLGIYKLEVQTLKGSFNLRFPRENGQDAQRLRCEVADALNRHSTGQRDIRALIWSINPN
jgi:predicted RNA-binding Zn-ribbon protein involved in translation (DUF1610 family)